MRRVSFWGRVLLCLVSVVAIGAAATGAFKIANAATIGSCIITLFGQQYDVTSLQSAHTGGNIFVCGTDMTASYQSMHGTDATRMIPYLIQASPTPTPTPTQSSSPLPSATPSPTGIPSPSPSSSPSPSPVTVHPCSDDQDDRDDQDEDRDELENTGEINRGVRIEKKNKEVRYGIHSENRTREDRE